MSIRHCSDAIQVIIFLKNYKSINDQLHLYKSTENTKSIAYTVYENATSLNIAVNRNVLIVRPVHAGSRPIFR